MLRKYLQKNAIIARSFIKTEANKMYSNKGKPLTNDEIKDLLSKKLNWKETGNGEYPLFFKTEKHDLKIKVNDFPAEPLYSLIVDDKPVIDLESLPKAWETSLKK